VLPTREPINKDGVAAQYAQRGPQRIILIDGSELTRLMMQYGVGVRTDRTVELNGRLASQDLVRPLHISTLLTSFKIKCVSPLGKVGINNEMSARNQSRLVVVGGGHVIGFFQKRNVTLRSKNFWPIGLT
jgi:hypothetical protein